MKKEEEIIVSNNDSGYIYNEYWFEENFLDKFYKSVSPLKREISERKFRLIDDEITSRVLNHWQKEGLIVDNRPDGKGWRKYSFSDIVWLQIIKKLRSFGFEIAKIKMVKDKLDRYNSEEDISLCPLLDFYIIEAKEHKMPIKMLVYTDGGVDIARQIDIDDSTGYFLNQDYISINISAMINIGLGTQFKDYSITDYTNYNKSDIEKSLSKALVFEEAQSVAIKLVKEDEYLLNKTIVVESKEEMNELVSKMNYSDSTVSKSGKKKVYKVTEKLKVKKE